MNQTTIFNEHDIDWNRLASIGIEKEFLKKTGLMNALLAGMKTEPMPFVMPIFNSKTIVDASLRLQHHEGNIEIVIEGVGLDLIN